MRGPLESLAEYYKSDEFICAYCKDAGEVEMDNGGGTYDCPICKDADKRPPINGWSPGMYTRRCGVCESEYLGGKRSMVCAPCAYGGKK